VLGLLSLCLLLCASCCPAPSVVTVPQVIRVTPPAFLMDATPEPFCDPATNSDLWECFTATRSALRKANADKAAIREAVQEDK